MQIFKRLSKVAIMLAAVVAFASCTEKQELNEDDLLEGMYKIDVQGVTFYMIEVEGGMFTMGAQGIDFDALEDEMPTHNVELSKYYIGETEVTQALWQAVMDTNPSRFNIGDVSQKPVENVSWNDCQLFVDRLNQLCEERLNQLSENYTDKKLVFAVPTEAQWEFAARGGVKSKTTRFSGSNYPSDVAWFIENSATTKTVKTKDPNELGIYDMSGNVSEWCSDWYGLFSATYQENPLGHHSGTKRVVRGGSWTSTSVNCRCTARDSEEPQYHNEQIGLRLVLKLVSK